MSLIGLLRYSYDIETVMVEFQRPPLYYHKSHIFWAYLRSQYKDRDSRGRDDFHSYRFERLYEEY